MRFPVDLLADVGQAELEQSAHNYMNNLLYSNPDSPEHLILSDSTQVTIDISSVGFAPLYGLNDKQRVLALFSPSEPSTAVALYLLDQWWTVDDILKTVDPARDGAVGVETLGERIVLYILNRVIYRAKEMSSEELPFLCHGPKDYAKILWKNGEAVGFYSVKTSGSSYNSSSTRSYLLPVMDSIFVKKRQRAKGYGLEMLEDFVLSFKEECLGLKYPLPKSMYKVCQKYLCQYPEHKDLLWEVESIAGPNQRTNIANKIKAMDLSAVSKSFSFTEESLVITEVTEKDVVMEAVTMQIKEAEPMACTVETVEEVTVLRTTKEDELPVVALGMSSDSKQRQMGENITEDKSEKVIRIEDIEAETPREKQSSAQQKKKLYNVSESVQTGGMFSVAPEEKGEDAVDNALKEAAATMSDKPITVLASQDLEEANVISPLTAVEPQVEDNTTQDLNNTSHDLQIPVGNVASEVEEAEEECQREGTAVLVVSEEVLEVHKEAETLNKEGEGTQIEVNDDKSEERVTQHVVSLSTHAASEGGETGSTVTVVKAKKTVKSKNPGRRSQRHRKERTAAQDEGRVLRGRTVMSSTIPKRKYKQHSQKVLEKEVDDVSEKNEVSAVEVVEELAVTEEEESEEEESTFIKANVVAVEELRGEKVQLEDEQLTNEEATEKQEEPGVDNTVVKGSTSGLPDTADASLTEENEHEKVTGESEKEQKGEEVETSGIQDKQGVSDDETEDPPVVQKRAFRGRFRVTPKPKSTKQNKRLQNQEEKPTDEPDLRAGGSASEEKVVEEETDRQMGEHHPVEQEETVDKTDGEISTEELTTVEEKVTEDIIPSTEANVGEHKEVQECKETEGGTETVADKEEEVDDMIQEPDTVAAASETVIPVIPVAEEPQEKDIGSEIPKLQKATVILVDLKTTFHHLSVKGAEETPADGECAAPEEEQMELVAAEEKEVSSCVAEQQTPEPEMLLLEDEDGGKQENSTEISAEGETAEKEVLEEDSSDKEKEKSANVDGEKGEGEEAPVIETRILRSGRKLVKAGNQQQEEDSIGEVITEKKMDEAETGIAEVEGGEREVMAKDGVTVTVPVEECAGIEEDITVVNEADENVPPGEVDEAMSLEKEDAPVGTRATGSGTKTATPKLASERKEGFEPEIDVEEGKAVAEERQDLVEKQSEAISKTVAEKDVEASGDERKSVMGGEEVELPSVAITIISLRSCGGTPEAPPKNRSRTNKKHQEKKEGGESEEQSGDEDEPPAEPRILRRERKPACRNCKQLQKEEEGPKESAEETEVEEEEEAGLGSAKEPPIEGDKGKVPEEDKMEVEKKEFPVKVGKGVSEAGTMTMTEEEESTPGVTAVADDLVQEGETDTPLPIPATNSIILTPSDEDATPSAEEQSEEMVTQLSDLQRVTVVLVDLKKPHHEVHGETATVERRVPVEKTAAEAEEEQWEETTKEEEIMAEEHVPSSPVGIEKTGVEKVVVEEEGFVEKVEHSVTIQDKGEGRAEEMAKDDEAKNADDEDDDDDEDEEPTVTKTRTLRSTKQIVKATPRDKSSRQKKSEEEKEETSEIGQEEPTVQIRVLRGRKSIPVVKRTHKQLQEGEEEKEEEEEESTAGEERGAEEQEEQAEEQEHMIDQESAERLEEKDATQQVENIEADMGIEKVDTVAEEPVTLEEHQAGSTETGADEDTEASVRQSTGKGKTSDDVAEEAATTQDTVEGEQLTSISEVALLRAKDDKAKCVSEEEEEPVIQTRVLRSGEKTVRATPRSKTTKRDQQDEEATGEKSREGDEPATEMRVLRRGRRSAAATPKHKSKRARTQCETEEEGKDETTPPEEMQAEETKAMLKERKEKEQNKNESIEEKNEEEAAAQTEENTEPEDYEPEEVVKRCTGDELAVERRVLRKGRRSATVTPRHISKRARTQCQPEEEGEKETTQAEEIEGEEIKANTKEDNSDEKLEEKDGEEPVAQKEENTEQEVEMNKVQAVAEESLTKQETEEAKQSAVSKICANDQKETLVVESAEEKPNTDEGKITDEEEAPVVETRILRCHGKALKASPRSKTTTGQQEENEQEGTVVEKSGDRDEPAVETRVLRKGRRSAPATPRHKSKRARIQCQPEEEGKEETTPAEETAGEVEEVMLESPEEEGEKVEEERKSMEMEVKKGKDVEEEDVESLAVGESAVGDAEQMKDASTEVAAVLEKEDCSMTAVDKTDTDMANIETNSVQEEETTVKEKSTAVTGVGSHTAVAEEETVVVDESVVTEEEVPAVTTRTLRSKTKTLHATPSKRSRRQKGQGVVESQEQEEENPEDKETQEVHQVTVDSPENGGLTAREQTETDETSPTGQEAGSPAGDNGEDQAKDSMDNKLVESAGEEAATEEMEPSEEEPESEEDKTVDPSVVEGRNLRGSMKTKIQLPKRRSTRKRRRVDYNEDAE